MASAHAGDEGSPYGEAHALAAILELSANEI
jgi:hypothetical protein